MAAIRRNKTPGPSGQASRPGGTPPARTGDKSIATVVAELWQLTVAYAKQEIRDPIVGLGAYLAWGVATMVLAGLGSVLLAIGGLRALQTETGSTFTGNLSWAPYLIVLAVSIIVLGIVGTILTRNKK